jgi:pyrrolidone-carboxylate peptidase
VVVNFGVAAGRTMISLETLGKNIKDFRVADERGNKFA